MTLFVSSMPRGFLRLSGPDARTWLQGLISNDVNRLTDTQVIHADLLTPQGKHLFHMFLWPDQNDILIETTSDDAEPLMMRLSMYKLRADIALNDVSENFRLHVGWGNGISEVFGEDIAAGALRTKLDQWVAVDPRHATLGLRFLTKTSDHGSGIDRDLEGKFERVDAQAYRAHQSAMGVFDPETDLVKQKTTLLEANFDLLAGVDFEKGCYVGQELTARMHFRALVKKRQLPFSFDGDTPASGEKILADGTEIGEVMSVSANFGMALIRLDRFKTIGNDETPIVTDNGSELKIHSPLFEIA